MKMVYDGRRTKRKRKIDQQPPTPQAIHRQTQNRRHPCQVTITFLCFLSSTKTLLLLVDTTSMSLAT